MSRQFCCATILLGLLALAVPGSISGRGFGGGGGFHGGGGGFGGGGFGGGGFGGGGFHGGGGFGGGGFGGGGFSGGGFDRGGMSGLGGGGFGGGGIERSNFGGGGFGGGGIERSNFGGGGLSGDFSSRGLGGTGLSGEGLGGDRFGGLGGTGLSGQGGFARDSFGDRFGGNAPSRSSLGNFLGLPSDEGMHGLSGTKSWSGDNFDINHGSYVGPRGGAAAGTTVTGPRGNTVGRGAAVGPQGAAIAGRGFEGAGGAAGGQAIARGPGGRVAGGGAIRGPGGSVAARGFVAGPHGVAGGFARVSPSGRYSTAVGVRTSFNHWGIYGHGWYRDNPGAWFAAGWAAGAAWTEATWASAWGWCGCDAAPIYYDYGNNVTYENNNVYINGQDSGTSQEYYNQAQTLAETGTQADAPADGDWLPLGIFALSKAGQTQSDVTIQLAVNKQGILRGNYTDTVTGKTQLVHGSVDKSTQRVAFTVGDNTTTVIETGLYNLTKEEAPCLLHFGQDRTEQWLLVRLQQPDAAQPDAAQPADTTTAEQGQ